MLTKADDFPIHQTPEPIAYAGTDRNFYDRYFFNGYQPDGTEFFAIAFGVLSFWLIKADFFKQFFVYTMTVTYVIFVCGNAHFFEFLGIKRH